MGNRSTKKKKEKSRAAAGAVKTLSQRKPSLTDKLEADGNKQLKRMLELYDKQDELGRGKFGTVSRGVRKSDGQVVAIKIIKRNSKNSETIRKEVAILEQVGRHPSIVELYDVYSGGRLVCLVMEYCSGGELFDRLCRAGPYRELDAMVHMKRVLEAIRYLHSRGVIHRDLKPENILLKSEDPDSELRVTDFGLSLEFDPDRDRNSICGTWAYACPEMRTEQGRYDEKADLWSFGVIMFIILSGYHPFDPDCGASENTMHVRALENEWNFDDPAWDCVSDTAKDLIGKFIELDADQRLSAEEALEHPWFAEDSDSVSDVLLTASDREDDSTHMRLSLFQDTMSARRNKLKSVAKAIVAVHRMSSKNLLDDARTEELKANGDGQVASKDGAGAAGSQ